MYQSDYTVQSGIGYRSFFMNEDKIGKFEPQKYGYGDSCFCETHPNNHLVNTRSVCYPLSKKEVKEVPAMSFVGMSFFEDKIIAFADTKSTKIDSNGNMSHDEKRGIVHKLFSSENYILAMHGPNLVAHIDEGLIVKENIEDVVKKLNTNGEPKDLVESFVKYLRTVRADGLVEPYHMMFGQMTNGMSKLENYTIVPNEVTLSEKYIHPKCSFFSGATSYCDYYTFNSENLLIDDGDAIREELERAIRFRDAGPTYNPVGLPVDVITWRPSRKN